MTIFNNILLQFLLNGTVDTNNLVFKLACNNSDAMNEKEIQLFYYDMTEETQEME